MSIRSNKRIRKIKALASRPGTPGEKAAAIAALARLDPSTKCLYAPCTGCPVRCVNRSVPTLPPEVQNELTSIQRHFQTIG
jgi:hypothetical protein